MQKYVLYDNELTLQNIIVVADTKEEINSEYRISKVFRRMVGCNELPQMALVEMSEEELKTILD